MGVVANVGTDAFPEQGTYLNRRAFVCFRYDTANSLGGTIVRDDMEEPWVTIIRLDDGRHVLTSECQYSLDMTSQTEAEARP